MRMSMKGVPLPVQRLAAQHLEWLRGTEPMNGMEDARLADTAVPIHRPDIDGVAYSGFAAMGGRGAGTAPSARRARRAAEDANGRLVGQLGQIPALIVGQPHRLACYDSAIAGAIAMPFGEQRTDEGAGTVRHEVKTSGPDAPQLATAEPDGWADLKKRCANAFGPMLDHLRGRAARVWEIEEAVARFGEGILAGTTHRVALLDEAGLEITGDGARMCARASRRLPAARRCWC